MGIEVLNGDLQKAAIREVGRATPIFNHLSKSTRLRFIELNCNYSDGGMLQAFTGI